MAGKKPQLERVDLWALVKFDRQKNEKIPLDGIVVDAWHNSHLLHTSPMVYYNLKKGGEIC